MAWSWDFMIVAFKALGGIVENVAWKNASGSAALRSADPASPAGIRVPEKLIVPASETELVEGKLKLKAGAAIGSAERSFLQNYLESFAPAQSHGDSVAFLQAVNALPDDVRRLLADDFGVAFPEIDMQEGAQAWLLQKRFLPWRGQPALVPVLEFVTHDPLVRPWNESEGITLTGTYAGELGMLRFRSDPFGAFWRLGYPSREQRAFSLPMAIDMESGRHLMIERSFNSNRQLGGFRVPEFELDEKSIRFSGLMVGSITGPRISRGIFHRVMKEANEPNSDEVFDSILHINRLSFLKLLEVLEPHDGGLIRALRTVVRYQLEAMSWCVGTRDL